MARRGKKAIIPGRAEVLGGVLVVVVLATIVIVRGGPELSVADSITEPAWVLPAATPSNGAGRPNTVTDRINAATGNVKTQAAQPDRAARADVNED